MWKPLISITIRDCLRLVLSICLTDRHTGGCLEGFSIMLPCEYVHPLHAFQQKDVKLIGLSEFGEVPISPSLEYVPP